MTSGATVNSSSMLLFNIIIISGVFLCSCVWLTIVRIYSKLDSILRIIYKYETTKMFKIIQKEARRYKYSFVNVNIFIGFYIPLACIVTLIMMGILMNIF